MSKNKVTKVELLWSENIRYQQRFKGIDPKNPPAWPTIPDANAFMVAMALEGRDMGYDKTAFRITWEDGEMYEGRYDLHKYGQRQENPNGCIDLADHVRSFISFCAGLNKPNHMSQADYERLVKMYCPTEEKRAEFVEFLEQHEL